MVTLAMGTAVSPWNTTEENVSSLMEQPPRISDCTLRDGEQQAGLVFSVSDKVQLAMSLAAAGVHDIEAGTPAVSIDDRKAVEEIVNLGLGADTSALARAREADILVVSECGVDAVRISLPISPRQRAAKIPLTDDEYVRLAVKVCSYAKGLGLDVIFSPYDTTRCDLRFLERVLQSLHEEECVDRIRLVDTAGAATPAVIRFLVRVMDEAAGGTPIEIHCHDDLGLATANTLAGALAGAEYLSVTVNGLGERSGNAALEEVVMALAVLYGIDTGVDTTVLKRLSDDVERRSGLRMAQNKSVVGNGAFAHESGAVVAGVLVDPFTAEPYSPEAVGQVRRIVLGKKSGARSVEAKLEELGFQPSVELVNDIVLAVKQRAMQLKRGLDHDEFMQLLGARAR